MSNLKEICLFYCLFYGYIMKNVAYLKKTLCAAYYAEKNVMSYSCACFLLYIPSYLTNLVIKLIKHLKLVYTFLKLFALIQEGGKTVKKLPVFINFYKCIKYAFLHF